MEFFYADQSGGQQGPVPGDQLLSKGIRAETLVWAEGMAQWTRADAVPELHSLFSRPAPAAPSPFQQQPQMPPQQPPTAPLNYGGGFTPPQYYPPRSGDNNKIAAGLCGILIGWLGIHKFILGMPGAGLTMLLVTVLTCGMGGIIMGPIGLIEGIIYLTKSDEEFYQTYVVQKKSWF